MEFGLSEEQVMLQDALARFLSGTGGLVCTRALAARKDRRAPDVLLPLILISESTRLRRILFAVFRLQN